MTVLLLRLSGPLQSWGDSSRFVRRGTRTEPTKSGVIGLLGSALGRSREDSLDDLRGLEFGVRADQPGHVTCDFQTERPLDGGKAMPLSYRYYLADAKFLVALSGDDELLQQLQKAVCAPRWPLFLGRRSCPPDKPICLGLHDEYADVRDALSRYHWVAADWYQRRARVSDLEICCDAREGEPSLSQADSPLTFSGSGRKYASRGVYRFRVPIDSLEGAQQAKAPDRASAPSACTSFPGGHDPMGFF